MDCQTYCSSSLPRIWAIETLACSNQIDISLLLDLLEKTPEISNDIGRNAKELVSLKILESLFIRGARANHVSHASYQKIGLDPSDCCEVVLRRILSETSLPHLKSAGPEISKWDLKPFIEHKRLNLPKNALKQLKEAILTGSHPISAFLKEQSGLPVGNQSEHEAPVKDGNCNGITPGERSDTNNKFFLPRDLPDENLVRVNRKRRATSENAAAELCATHIDSVKKYKHDIICTEQYLAGKLTSSGIDRRVADESIVSEKHIGGQSFVLRRKTHVGSIELNEPPKDENNEFSSSKAHVGIDNVLSGGKQLAYCDDELKDKSEEQGQDQNIEKAKYNKKGFSNLKGTNQDGNEFVQDINEVEEIIHVSNDIDGNDEGMIDIAWKKNASFGPQCTQNQDSLTTNCRDQNLVAGTSNVHSGEERCSIEKKTRVEVMGKNEPSVDGNNQCTSSKDIVGHDEVPHEKQAPHCGAEVPNGNSDQAIQNSKGENAQSVWKSFDGLITMNEGLNKFDQNIPRIISTNDEAEDIDKSNDNDGYQDERSRIDTKKKIFLSSQCTYSQDSLATTDWRELHLCMKCNKGGKLMSCSSDSCPLVIHESCLGSDASFGTGGEFFCPFCAYSRAISKYMEVKEKTSLTRKELTTFICLEPQQESKKHSEKSFGIEGNHLQQTDDLPKSNELNQRDAEKVSDHQRRNNLEFEEAGPSELRSDYSPPFGRKAIRSTNRLAQSLNKEKRDWKNIGQVSQSPRVNGQKQIAALEICNPQDETTSTQVSETSGSEEHADVRSKRKVLRQSGSDLPRERKCSRSAQSSDAEELSEKENESSGASKYFIRVQKQERQNPHPAIPQLRRKRLPWTSKEEDTIKKGVRLFCSPHEKIIPWKKILEFGNRDFHSSRSTMDLKDKWRNMCKASPKFK